MPNRFLYDPVSTTGELESSKTPPADPLPTHVRSKSRSRVVIMLAIALVLLVACLVALRTLPRHGLASFLPLLHNATPHNITKPLDSNDTEAHGSKPVGTVNHQPKSDLLKRLKGNQEGDLSLEALAEENLQHRATIDKGRSEDGFVQINLEEKARRRQNMKELDEVRVSFCGDVETGQWEALPSAQQVVYYNDTSTYAEGRLGKRPASRTYMVERRVCGKRHPRLHDSYVRIERLGPFRSSGGYDWTVVFGWKDAGSMKAVLKDKRVFIRGRMFAPVHANGTLINFPPLHIHHAHILPYSHKRLEKKILPQGVSSIRIGNHHVLVQAHGDTICKDEEGGVDCLLSQLDDDKGYRIDKSTGFPADFEINDARHKPLDDLEFFVDLAFIYTETELKPTTFMQMGNPPIGYGWQTYMFPLEPHTNLMYYNYTNAFLGDGEIDNFVMHTHMTSFDSIYVFKGRGVYGALEEYRRRLNGALPLVFECHGLKPTVEKATILRTIQDTDGSELVCEGTKPSLKLECEGRLCSYRDKRISFNCRRKVELKASETLVVVAFNKVRNSTTTPLTRSSTQQDLAIISPFGMGYAAHQHSFFRADFVSKQTTRPENWNKTYAPPALFVYAEMPYRVHGVMEGARRILQRCPQRFTYHVDLPWNMPGLT